MNDYIFDFNSFFNVFLYNFDIYSFVLLYSDILLYNFSDHEIQVKISILLRKYCFNTKFYISKYDISQIINDLNDITNLIPEIITEDDISSDTSGMPTPQVSQTDGTPVSD